MFGNRKALQSASVILGLVAVAGAVDSAAAGNQPPVSFKRDVLPVFQVNCVSCHQSGGNSVPMGGLSLVPAEAYGSLVKMPSTEIDMLRVKPGSPENSYLSRKLHNTHVEVNGMGNSMPILVGPLPKSEIDRIDMWIKQGAKNN